MKILENTTNRVFDDISRIVTALPNKDFAIDAFFKFRKTFQMRYPEERLPSHNQDCFSVWKSDAKLQETWEGTFRFLYQQMGVETKKVKVSRLKLYFKPSFCSTTNSKIIFFPVICFAVSFFAGSLFSAVSIWITTHSSHSEKIGNRCPCL